MYSENTPNRACEIENYDIATRIWDLDNALGVRTTESGAGREKAESVIRAASQIYFSVESVDFMSLENAPNRAKLWMLGGFLPSDSKTILRVLSIIIICAL